MLLDLTARRPSFGFLAAFLAAASAVAGCLSEPSNPDAAAKQDTSGDPASTSLISNFTWNSGPIDGDVAFGLALLPEAEATCTFFAAAMGISRGLPPTMALLVTGGVEYPFQYLGRGQGGLDPGIRIEAGGVIEQRVPDEPFPWADAVMRDLTLQAGKETNVTFAGDALKFMDAKTRPFWTRNELNTTSATLHVSCSPDVRVVQAFAGSEVAMFDEASFSGGVEAHADAVFDPTGVAVAGRVAMDVKSTHGTLVLHFAGDVLTNHVAAGLIQVSYPGGSDLIVERPSQFLLEHFLLGNPLDVDYRRIYQGGVGSYTVDATYASLEVLGMLWGAIIGFSPIGNLPTQPA